MIDREILELLNAGDVGERLNALCEIAERTDFPERDPRYINNHVHTCYSFSPYSPTAAVYSAADAGLCTVGIIDHDSIGGVKEFLEAADILAMPATSGLEFRVDVSDLPMGDRRINNPDQDGVIYMTVQGLPESGRAEMEAFLKPLRAARNDRNRAMTDKLNELLAPYDMALDFDRDIVPLSQADEGGSITERHLMYALALKLADTLGKGQPIIDFFAKQDIALGEKDIAKLEDTEHPFYAYDLLGILKAHFIGKIYLPAKAECPSLDDAVAIAEKTGGILCYAYLGDVVASVTGDKKAQVFEDGFLEELLKELTDRGVKALTYMPARNTPEQLARLRELCERYELFQISGEDINSPRQDFICHAMENPVFENLIRATWALIVHERVANGHPERGFFGSETVKRFPDIKERVDHFVAEAAEMFPDAEVPAVTD